MTSPQPAPSQWTAPPQFPDPALPAGLVVAGMGRRIGAYIIDSIILSIPSYIIVAIMASVGLWITRVPNVNQPLNIEYNYPALVIDMAIGIVISFSYWTYSWRQMRASLGQRALGLQVGDAATGATLTTEQTVRRWVALGVPFALVSLVVGIPAIYIVGEVCGLLWFLALLITTANNPRRQGIHDRFAGSLVVQEA